MLKRIGAEESGEFKAIASGTLPSGKPVVVNADGTVSVVGLQSGAFSVSSSNFAPSTGTGSNGTIVFDPNDDTKFVFVYDDAANSNYGTAVIGTISGTSISFGTPVVFVSGYFASPKGCVGYSADGTKVVINVRNFSNSNYGSIIAASVSGTVLTFGSANTYQSNTTYSPTLSCDPFDSTKFVFTYRNSSGSTGEARVGTLSGTSVSYGSAVTFNNATTYDTVIRHNPNTQNKVMIVWNDNGQFSGTIGTVSGTSISFGSETTLASNAVNEIGLSFDPDSSSNKVVAVMSDTTNAKAKAIVCSVSGSTITVGSTVEFFSSGYPNYLDVAFSKDTANEFYVGYRTTVFPLYARAVVGTVSGTTCSFANDTQVSSGNSYFVVLATNASGNILYGYRDNDSTSRSIIALCSNQAPNLTSENYIGMSRGVAFQTGSAASAGTTVTFCANLTLMHKDSSVYDSSNNKVVIGYAGSSSGGQRGNARVGTIDNSDNSITFGSEVEFESGGTDHVTATFDSNSNKVVFAYRDEGNSNAGTAVVGTVSGTSISFGTPVVFESGSTLGIGMTFDTNSNKVVISYSDQTDGQDGTAVVGTVSGTSISFGSPVKFEVGNVDYTSATFDSSNNKVVISFSDNDNSNYGTAIVGTVSGTSISFGSAVVFASEYTVFNPIVFDSSNNKVVVSYRAGTDGDKGKSVVGTVSGTSISFGSVATFNDAGTSEMSAVFDTSLNQVVIAYQDTGNSNQGTAIAGTVSGTSISFGSELIYQTGAVADNTLVYDTNANRFAVFYRDNGSPYNGKANVFNTSTAATTRAEVADGGKASMDIIGSVSDNQIGLTAGQQYFVQTDGTIGTTADSPSVLAGTAISATEILVKT